MDMAPSKPQNQEGGGQPKAAAFQAPSQDAAAALEPAFDRRDGTAQYRRRLIARASFQATENKRRMQQCWQSRDFLIDDAKQLSIPEFISDIAGRALFGNLGEEVLLRRGRCRFEGGANGHAVQPSAERPMRLDQMRLAKQGQKHGLKRILAIGLIAYDPPAHAPDQRSVTFQQFFKSRGLALSDKAAQ